MDVDPIRMEEEQPESTDEEILVQEIVPTMLSVDLTASENLNDKVSLGENVDPECKSERAENENGGVETINGETELRNGEIDNKNGQSENIMVEDENKNNMPEPFSWRTTRRDNRIKKEFKCQECSKTFSTQTSYEDHKSFHTLTNQNYIHEIPCQKCDKILHSNLGLINHNIRMHSENKDKKYMCAICELRFKTNIELIEHKSEHVNAVFRCALRKRCSELTFTDHYEYLIHNLTHSKTTKPKCVECGTYIRARYIKQHMLIHYRGLRCMLCSVSCLTEKSLHEHVKNHENVFKCVECGKLFASKYNHDKHMQSHTMVRLIQCLYCGKGFGTTQQRDQHTMLHTGETPFTCDICGHKARTVHQFKNHRRTHSKEKRYQCDYCNKKFTTKGNLGAHIREHIKKGIYKCKECSYCTASKTALTSHILFKHTDEKPFSCDICKLSFKTEKCVAMHKLTIGHRNKEYKLLRNKIHTWS